MSAPVIDRPAGISPAEKHLATLMAKFALRGHAVHRVETGGYLVTRHNMHRYCGDLESLEAFARQVGAIA